MKVDVQITPAAALVPTRAPSSEPLPDLAVGDIHTLADGAGNPALARVAAIMIARADSGRPVVAQYDDSPFPDPSRKPLWT